MRKSDGPTENPIEYALLGLLYKSPRYGYELYRSLRVKSGLGLIWTVKQAQLYSILVKFESKGLLSVAIDDSGSIVRKMYRLTPQGKSVFVDWVKSPCPRKNFRLEFLAKLYLTRIYFQKSAMVLIDKQMELCDAWLSDMIERSSMAERSDTDYLVLRYRTSQLESMRGWLMECKEVVASKRSAAVDKEG